MKYTLMEQKFTLQESKFILAEELTQNSLDAAIDVVDRALKQVEDSDISRLQTAYEDYKITLGRTNTTGNSTSDLTAVKDALTSFWKTFKSTKFMDEDNLTEAEEVTKIINKNKSLINRVDKLVAGSAALPDEDGNEINKKLWLRAAIDVENAFGNLIPELQVELNKTSTDGTTKNNLEFIKKSLLIFKNSINDIKIEENRKAIDQLISSITAENIANPTQIATITSNLKKLNATVKKSNDAQGLSAGEEKTRDESWDELYKKTTDKNAFWSKYFKEFWGSNANRIISLGSVFKEECETYGFTDSNPFIKFIKYFLFKASINFTGAQYQAIHNAIASGRGGKVKDLNDLGEAGAKTNNIDEDVVDKGHNILAYRDLYTKPGKEIGSYMQYAQIVNAKSNNTDNDFKKMLFHDGSKPLLKSLTDIRAELETIGWNEKALSANDVELLADLITSGATSRDAREVGEADTCILMLWTYFLSTDAQNELQDILHINDLSKKHFALAVKKAKESFDGKYGKPTANQAKEILTKVASNLRKV